VRNLRFLRGEGQLDVGEALVKWKGVLGKAFFFVMSLPYSGAVFAQVFERSCTEAFWEAHGRAFAYLGGVPRRITYDNDRTLVAKIIGGCERKLTQGFLQLRSHYLFETHLLIVTGDAIAQFLFPREDWRQTTFSVRLLAVARRA
jgi:transposase